jgi:YggT family protein
VLISQTAVGLLIATVLELFLYLLFARIIIDYIMMFARSWQPKGLVLALVDVVFRITDPPMKFVRRFVPPLRIGQVALDVGFLVLFFGVQILIGLLGNL